MKTIAIIAEFNPFHNGHQHLISQCKKDLEADRCIVIMSGDFVQRGAPAIVSKFSRTRMVLSCGADLVLELPLYYSCGSAEYFAQGAVSILDRLGIVDYLCFGSESGNIDNLAKIAGILTEESSEFKSLLSSYQKNGDSFALARQKALLEVLDKESPAEDLNKIKESVSSPNNILGIEYIKALLRLKSSIKPYTIERLGEGYNSDALTTMASATAIRHALFNDEEKLEPAMPKECLYLLTDYKGKFADTNLFSDLLYYKLISEKELGYSRYLDVTEDLSNKILANLESYTSFDGFCTILKSKDMTYSRISRCLTHILLDITSSNMEDYKKDSFTSYARILGMKETAFPLLKEANDVSQIPIINGLKNAEKELNELELRLLNETLSSSLIYNRISCNNLPNEYRMKPIIC